MSSFSNYLKKFDVHFHCLRMPSDAKKKQAQRKKDAAKKREQPKKKGANIENDEIQQNGIKNPNSNFSHSYYILC